MNILARAKDILLQPGAAWTTIEADDTSASDLYMDYIVPLATIGPIATFIGLSLVGTSVPLLGHYRVPLISGALMAMVSYALALVGVFIFALVIDALAPVFGGRKDRNQALKVAAHAFTPVWLASALMVVPALGMLTLLAALYAIYLLYRGLPIVMKSEPAKSLPYTASAVVVACVIQMIVGAASAAIANPGTPQTGATDWEAVSGQDALEDLTIRQRQKLENLQRLSAQVKKPPQGDH